MHTSPCVQQPEVELVAATTGRSYNGTRGWFSQRHWTVERLQKLCISPLTWSVFFISQLGSVLTSLVITVVGNLAVNVIVQVCAIA